MNTNRRNFLKNASMAAGAMALSSPLLHAKPMKTNYFFDISLAQWSLREKFWKKKIDNLDFPQYTKNTYGIDAVEYVSGFFPNNHVNIGYAKKLKQRADDAGVKSVLIMIDMWMGDVGKLASLKEKERKIAVENHHKWIDAAKELGCHSIRVNAHGYGDADYKTAQEAFVDGLGRLGEYGAEVGVAILVENHGGWSSSGKWLAEVMKQVDSPWVGTLPDFGNFRISKEESYDPYKGTKELMPYAKGVSAKSMKFNEDGEESNVDYTKLMEIVKKQGYTGHVGIEWGGGKDGTSADDGVMLTKKLLEKVGEKLG